MAARKSETHFNKAIELGEEIGARGVTGPTYLALGQLHKAKKRIEKAKECITKAIQIFEQCGAGEYLRQAKEELASLK